MYYNIKMYKNMILHESEFWNYRENVSKNPVQLTSVS